MKKLSILALGLALVGCQENLTRSDLISPYAGDAIARNNSNQMVDPWPPYVGNTNIETSSKRQADAREAYRNKHAKSATPSYVPIDILAMQAAMAQSQGQAPVYAPPTPSN